MKAIIQKNTFLYSSTATTQDNHGGIADKFDLFSEEDPEKKNSIGNLVKYFDGSFAVFHKIVDFTNSTLYSFKLITVRYDLPKEQVKFIES